MPECTRKKKKKIVYDFRFQPRTHPACSTAITPAWTRWWYCWVVQGIYSLDKTFATCRTFWLVSDVRRGSRAARAPAPAMTSLVQTSTWIARKPRLAVKHSKLPCGSWPPPDWELGLWDSDWLGLCRDSKSARLLPGTALRRTVIHQYSDPDQWFICKLELTVEPPTSTGCRQAEKSEASWAEAKLGQKHKSEIL